MVMKQTHCTPICTTPNSAAPQAVPEISRQQAISCWLVGNTRIFASAAIDDIVPSNTHQGDRPADVPWRMIFTCWGIYEMRMPSTSCLITDRYQNLDGRVVDAEIITRRGREPSHSARRDAHSMGRPSWREDVALATEKILRISGEFKGRQR